MADHSQQQQEASAASAKSRGGRQTIVELQRITRAGIILWSRQRFEIGSEVQIRVGVESLPEALKKLLPIGSGHWAVVIGYVVECPAVRRADGTYGFQVSVLLDGLKDQVDECPKAPSESPLSLRQPLPGHASYGLN
ncbi:MAG: hypothetical protein H7A55_18690 [Verrucomicrobiaceae bacterium]|nr:hypothetical protein [Verrucomicrobiaceae bacterium]